MRVFPYLVSVLVWFPWQADAGTVELTVEEPSGVERRGWPVTSGIPLAEGGLKNPNACALFTADGTELPLQTEALARWPDGSVRWLLLDFQVDLAPNQAKSLSLRYGDDVRRGAIDRPLRVASRPDGKVTLETGPVRLEYDPKCFMPQGAAWLTAGAGGQESDQRVTLNCMSDGVRLSDDRGQGHLPAEKEAEITIEQAGPVRACLRINGEHGEQPMFRYVARVHAWRGRPWIRVFYTFINDHQDALMAKIRQLEVRFWSCEGGRANTRILNGKPAAEGRLFQVDENQYLLDGKPVAGRGCGWAAVGSDRYGLAVGLREFWQNWPKLIECVPGRVSLELCPELPEGLYSGKPLEEENKLYYQLRDGLHTFKVGVAKTHELWVHYFPGKPDVEKLSDFFQAAEDPLLATCDPTYVASTKAAGELPPADPQKYFGYDAWLDRALEAHLKRRDQIREYGMLNYGDWFGERSVNWGNLEYDLAHGLFLQYLRTGDRRFFLRAEQAARHHIDVDVVHATNAHMKNPWGEPPRVGDIWLHCLNHTGGYYQNAPLPVSRTYQMGHSTNFGHVWVSGDLDYYFLTGDRRALEVSLDMADAMTSHMPTRYGTHIRALGWPMILVLRAYEATGDKKYLDAAVKNWQVLKENIDWERGWVVRLAGDHCLHPPGSTREERQTKYRDQRCEGNVPFMEGLTLCALARYHRLTGDPEVLKALSVGIDQMIRECWQEDVKTFRYTACPLSSKAPYTLFMLSTEAMAYEIAQTGNEEHLRILREGIRAAVPNDDGHHNGKSLAQMIFFTPHGLAALEEEVR
ncbi:MAG: exo-rhamnogalacturonan lyase family protein [Planctomycetota bacterium]|jgi:hypothetical protein